ncbi:HD family phosphohydrolase [Clostridium vincentii]|uniref:HD/PDEase domain-containing protein n=1 Tax=Clostridium vincentii TaxID=52704 RepID=A0A2T0BJ60_9CLOT|nr:HDIG domain-containing metalloprotein [Clostridium vincentii]PRR83919.1 hypothetical protein CLVI_05730 [Clostridium vincentii]
MRVDKNKGLNIRKKTKRIILFGITFVIAYSIIASAIVPKKYSLQVGDIPNGDIKATRDTIDEKGSEEKIQALLNVVDKQFTIKVQVRTQAEENIMGLLEKANALSISTLPENEKIAALAKLENIKLNNDECAILLKLSEEEISAIKDSVPVILDASYEKNVEDSQESEEVAQNIAIKEISNLNLNSDLETLLKNIFIQEIKPNFFYDEEKTQEKIAEIKKNTEKVIIKKNQIIINDGEPVTQSQIDVLKELGVLGANSGKGFVFLYLVLVILVGVVLLIQYYYINKNYNEIYNDLSKLLLISLLNVMSLLIARVLYIANPYLIPFACTPLLLTLLVNYKISLFTSVVNVILISSVVQFDTGVIIIALVNAVLGATILRKMQQRNDILYASINIVVLVILINFSVGVILSSNITQTLLNTLFAIVGVFISGILAIGLLPFLEGMFDIVTTLKLLELSNPNSPLLKKLLMEAPGSYHHSMLVANLAEMAAEEVNADPVITRIGAYYHDVGKITRPYFFKENQLTKENPHDKINASLSTLIIVSHVKEGLELAKEYKIPKIIQDIIAQHHGTTIVKYFYYTVKNKSEHPEEIKEEDFQYPGPIPSSKESGIIMLADSTEAAVRSIKDPTKGKIEEMVNNIIKDKLNTGQLDDCDLTLKDLGKIRRCFLKALNGIYHKRIEYPTEKNKK